MHVPYIVDPHSVVQPIITSWVLNASKDVSELVVAFGESVIAGCAVSDNKCAFRA